MADKQQYDNMNRGAIFKNDKKSKNSQPDYKGKINVGGIEYQQSMWMSTSKDGVKYFSVRITPIDDQQQRQQPEPTTSNSEMPF